MAAAPPLRNQEYTVGWICALPLEMAAARAMLDEPHGRPREQHRSDQNTYFLGRIGQHNIVIACLPVGVYGTTSAAAVAAQMLSTFVSIRVGLMVGIGGGVHSEERDIRLGDVVVSKPGKTLGGVVQYDFGKTIDGGQFKRTSSLNKPPRILLNAVAGLEAEHILEENKIPQFLLEMHVKYPRLKADSSYQGATNDHLYQADYDHVGGSNTCESCDASKVIDRPHRDTNTPLIHYGVIASGNQVIRHGVTRDRLREELDIICFEMEAAGLMDNFPCIVIRGICDYADSHKNKRWQQYAAATAAAYTKELLSIIPASQVETTLTAAEVIKNVSENLVMIRDGVTTINSTLHSVQRENLCQEVLGWLTEVNYAAQCSDFLTRRQEGTGLWLLNSHEFHAWLSGTQNTLFCPGIPGSGKTMMASIVVEYLWKISLENNFPDRKTGIAVLYCSYKGGDEQKDVKLLSALLKQLAQGQQLISEPLKDLHNLHKKRGTRPSLDEIYISLLAVLKRYPQVFIIIDALDECRDVDGTRTELISRIRRLQAQSNVKLMATSRFITKIEQEFKNDIRLDVRASNGDIERYLDSKMSRLASCVSDRPDLQQRIKTDITTAADGMFLLAQLHLDSLACKTTEKAINSALFLLPRGSEALDKAYGEAKERIDTQPQEFRDLAKRVLSWITYARRQLTMKELQHALAIDKGDQDLDETKIPGVHEIVSVCAGLVAVDVESSIIRLVHYTTQEYFERTIATWIPEAPTNIAITCLTYLSFERFKSGCSPSDAAFEDRIAQNVFLGYAASHWVNHTRDVQGDVKELALLFLMNESLASASNQATCTESFYRRYSQEMQTTGLHFAARFNLLEFVPRLLEYDKYNNSKDAKYGRTPLSWAAENGHKTVVKLLLEAEGVDVNSKDISGQTPLSWAAENGHQAVVKLLLEAEGVDVDSKDNDGRTPLSWATKNGNEAVVKLLLKTEGVDVDSKDHDGRTPLSWAATNGREAVVELLLETEGVDVNSKDTKYGQTPLSWAAENGHQAVVELLLKTECADVDSKENDGRTPLSWAATNGREAVVKLLLKTEGVDVDSKDNDGRTPLSWAAKNGRKAIVELLLETEGVDVDSKDTYGRTPLSWAAINGHEAVVELLLKTECADVDSKDNDGRTPLSWAATNGREAVVKLLLETEGVDVDSKDTKYGQTPLSWAAENGHEAVVKLLLKTEGVDVDSKDNDGWTPLSWAAKNGHEAIVKLLESRITSQ